MKYTAEQIKPKNYPQNKPSESGFNVQYRVLMDDGRQALFDWNPVTPSETMMTWDRYVTWFIDIPNPPSELKFLAYPQNKPEQDGEYWTHHAHTDEWKVHEYKKGNLCWWKAGRIDYFINVRLDKENEMENGIVTNIIYNSYDIIVSYYDNKTKIMIQDKLGRFSDPDTIGVTLQELTAFARHWLALQGENKYKDAIQKIAARIETYDETGYPRNLSNLVEIIEVIVGDCLQDVLKREPELLPCPFCGGECYTWNPAENDWSVACQDCTYNSGCGDSESEAIRLHNLIADNARTRKEK